MRPYQVCTRCVMDTSDPGITFDESGVCDQCRSFAQKIQPNWHTDERGAAVLEQMVAAIRKAGQSQPFDCIMGVSGGLDSSYLAFVAKRRLGLRPLVFHTDSGWNSQAAVHNIERLVDGLGLDLYTEVVDWEEMRDLQLAFIKSGVPHIDIPQDLAYMAALFNFAAKHNVKYILSGGNLSTECIRNPLDFFYYGTDMWQLRDIHRRFGSRPLRKFPLSSVLRHKVYLRYVKGIRMVKPLDHLPYTKAEASKLLQDEFGWQSHSQKHYESRFTQFYEGFWLPTRFGFDTRRVQYSSLVITGQLTRDEALAMLEKPSFDANRIDQEFEYVAAKLGIPPAELWAYHRAPKKTYRDYRSQHALFMLGAKIMHSFGLDERIEKR